MEDMFYAVINAVKELDSRTSAQEKKIKELEKRIEELEKRKIICGFIATTFMVRYAQCLTTRF